MWIHHVWNQWIYTWCIHIYHQWCTPWSDVFDYTMYLDDGSMMDVDTSCINPLISYMMYPHPSWIHRRDTSWISIHHDLFPCLHTSCNQIHQFRVYIIDVIIVMISYVWHTYRAIITEIITQCNQIHWMEVIIIDIFTNIDFI